MERRLKILLVGGGSGGHLTPLIAIANSIKKQRPVAEVLHIGQSGELLQDIIDNGLMDKSYSITAGKFRRYNGESFLQHLLDFKTLVLNFRDFFRFLLGTLQAIRLLRKLKPDVIMLKGGFVCVPVGLAARMLRIAYITHDSDAVPGLANKLTAKHAVYNAVALEKSIYPYDQAKTISVGIPIQEQFTLVTDQVKKQAKSDLGIQSDHPVLFCVGGGLGAQNLNNSILKICKSLLSEITDLKIIHLTGKKLFQETKISYGKTLNEAELKNIKLIDFSVELYKLSAASDIVITRGGATNIAEFAAQAKPCIVVPNPVLTGGQQLHNAKVLKDKQAAVIVSENDEEALKSAVMKLFGNKELSTKIADNLNILFSNDSADKIAELLIDEAEKKA
jgi:UDP-N-acetylglucosamine--N-acetylmuramyl-(pentapeptide) pyrophosphoryl-undecaprenol N-acetylglucosamine transferase